MQHISLLAAVPDATFLEDLRGRIGRQAEIVLQGEVRDSAGTLSMVSQVRPDVLLLANADSSGECCCDLALLAAAHHCSPNTKTILLTDKCTERSMAKALVQGARGCISTAAFPRDGLRAIRAVHRGEVWIGRKELASVLDDLLGRLERAEDAAVLGDRLERSEDASVQSPGKLSEREVEIVDAVRRGLTNKEIARKLRISPTTVKTHLQNIFHKLHVKHRVQLANLTRSPAVQETSAALNSLDYDLV